MTNLAQATHWIEILQKQPGEVGAMRLRDLASASVAVEQTLTCPVCGTAIPVPDGNLRNHLQQRVSELGGESAYVGFRIAHKPNIPLPRGTTRSRPALGMRHLMTDDEFMNTEVFLNPDPSLRPEQQEGQKVKDLLKRQKDQG
jgi:hypothetical protein